jgi:protein-S-isoprenylcysteine O-methyltransferase Ste14
LSKVNRWMKKHRTKLSGLLGVLFLIFAQPTSASLYTGVSLIIVGEAIRIWSSGNIHKNERLTTDGPYSLTRNPLYVGSFVLGTGFVIAMNVFWLAIVFLAFFAIIYWFTIRWEEEKLKGIFPHEWEEYSKGVSRFIPLLKIPRYRKGAFHWSQVSRNKELLNASVVLVVYAILWGKALLMG